MRIFFAHGGGEAFARWREEQGETLQEWAAWAAIAEEHGADWHAWPTELRRPAGARSVAAYVAAARRRRRLPRLAAVGAGAAVRRGRRGHDRHPGPADRRLRRRRRRLGLAGRARRGGQRRRAARRLQLPGPGLGLPAAGALAAAGRRLRAVHPVDPRHHRRRRRAAHRPRHGPVPALVGARRTGAPPTAPTSATRRRTCSTSSRWRATARRPSSSARTSARSRTASARPSSGARDPVLPAALVRGRRPRRVARLGDGGGQHPRPADGRRPLDRRRPDRAARAGHGHGRRARAWPEVAPGAPDRPAGRRLGRAGGRAGAPNCWAGRRRPCSRRPWTTPSAPSRRPNMPGPNRRPNWSPAPAGARRGPAAAPAAADGAPARSPPGSAAEPGRARRRRMFDDRGRLLPWRAAWFQDEGPIPRRTRAQLGRCCLRRRGGTAGCTTRPRPPGIWPGTARRVALARRWLAGAGRLHRERPARARADRGVAAGVPAGTALRARLLRAAFRRLGPWAV